MTPFAETEFEKLKIKIIGIQDIDIIAVSQGSVRICVEMRTAGHASISGKIRANNDKELGMSNEHAHIFYKVNP